MVKRMICVYKGVTILVEMRENYTYRRDYEDVVKKALQVMIKNIKSIPIEGRD